MTGEKPTFYPEIHGEYGLGPIKPPAATNGVIDENFYEIVEIIKRYGNELTIVNIGRLTSLATMFILYQRLMSNVKDYYLMGGAFWVPGNVTAVSEANFYADPIAANIVLTNAHDVTIIPLNVTEQAVVTPQRSEEHTSELQSRGHLVCRLLLEKKNRIQSANSQRQRQESQRVQ